MKRTTIAAVAAALLMASVANASQAASNQLPTNLPGATTAVAPPSGFDPLTASDEDLATYGFPPRPAQASPAYAAWARAMKSSRERIFPQLEVTDIQNTVNRASANPNGRMTNTVGYSSNWSGPVSFSGAKSYGTTSFYYIIGDYVVPIAEQAIGACTGSWDWSSQWVGIDGDGSSDVLQAGIEADALCSGGVTTPYYSAWYEWYVSGCNPANNPCNEVRISLPVTAGDDVFVEVWDTTSTQGYAYIVNENTNQYTQVGFKPPAGSGGKLVGNSAEWVVERPTVGGSLATLTNYTQDFFADSFAYTFGSVLYDPGTTSNTLLDMQDSSGCVISYPTTLGSYGIWFQDENSARFNGYC